jgi:hypothetical protein
VSFIVIISKTCEYCNLQSTQHECTLILFTINCRRYVACSSSSSELGGGPYIASGVLFYNTDPDLKSTESLRGVLGLSLNVYKTKEVNLVVLMVPKKLAYLKIVKSDRTLSVLVVLQDEKNPSYITAYDLRVVVPSATIASCFELEVAGYIESNFVLYFHKLASCN